MAGAILLDYAAAADFTVTNLHSLASSQSFIAGWNSASVDNSTNEYEDYLIGGTFTTHASNRQAGTIIVGVIGALKDTPVWPTVASGTVGTEGALAFTAVEQMQAAVRAVARIPVNNTASQVYAFPMTGIAQLFGGICPSHWALFVTGNASTTAAAQLASSGSALYYKPVARRYT